jgi:Flp pilus assembly pilin Flp
MTAQNLLREYQGHIVPQSYNAGFIALSLVGAGSTLELINKRTGLRGFFNQYASHSAVSNLTPAIRLGID